MANPKQDPPIQSILSVSQFPPRRRGPSRLTRAHFRGGRFTGVIPRAHGWRAQTSQMGTSWAFAGAKGISRQESGNAYGCTAQETKGVAAGCPAVTTTLAASRTFGPYPANFQMAGLSTVGRRWLTLWRLRLVIVESNRPTTQIPRCGVILTPTGPTAGLKYGRGPQSRSGSVCGWRLGATRNDASEPWVSVNSVQSLRARTSGRRELRASQLCQKVPRPEAQIQSD